MTNTNESPTQPTTRSPLEDAQRQDFADALRIARSGPAALADEATQTRAPSGRVVGAPRYFSNEALFTGLVLSGLQSGSLTLVEVTNAINLLPDDCLAELGLRRDPSTGRAVNLSQVDHAWNRLAEACNASPTREGRRFHFGEDGKPLHCHKERVVDRKYLRPHLSADEVSPKPKRKPSNRGSDRELTTSEAEQRERRLVSICDALIHATVPAGLIFQTVMMDWTDHETAARKRTRRTTCADPDAEYGARRPKNSGLSFNATKSLPRGKKRAAGTAEDPSATGALATGLDERGFETDKKEPFFGYNVHFAVGVGELRGPLLPELTLAIRVTPANAMGAVAPLAVDMLDTIRAAGHPIRTVGVDLGYSTRKLESLHVPLAERGVFLVYDLTKYGYGRHGTHRGSVLINGVPHCPFTPSIVRDENGDEVPLTIPGPRASRDDWKAYWELRDQQDRFQFRPLGKRKPDLKQRYQCPAVAERVRCSFYQPSLGLPDRANTPDIDVLMPEGQQPLACCGTSFTAGIEVGLGRRQEPAHGTREWVASYDRRSAVERFNSAIKRLGIDRMDILVLGRAKRTLMLAVAATVANIQLLRNSGASASAACNEVA